MSKTVVIGKTDGTTYTQTVDVIRTTNIGGGTVDWVPEDETVLTPITITQNGTYTPGANVYGFSTVKVNVQIVTGKKDNKTYAVTVDNNGYLVYTEVT